MFNGPITPDVITVNGYSQRYARAVRDVLGIEGGYANDPVDRGGETKYGISLRFLVSEGQIDLDGDGLIDFDLDMDGDIDGADIRALTKGDAIFLYHRCFWTRLDAESFPRPLGEAMFDQGVNGGLHAARKLLQHAINICYIQNPPNGLARLKPDGAIGPATRAALDSVLQYPGLGMPALMSAYRDAAADRYLAIAKRLPAQRRFLKGWLARADHLGRY
jgi:lysozyme family protein